ncbi:triacylglycerol lipase [Xylogone sp. PMI_703]|nr:triacylglycerol lipase [Xylogone sp. PMI_703]
MTSVKDFDGSHPRVTLRQGTYVGADIPHSYPRQLIQFLGIPYGASTAGTRRFRPPLPVKASSKTFDASKHGSRCPNTSVDATAVAAEDCLNANIYLPKDNHPRKKLLPVVISIHGGAFNFGSGAERDVPSLIGWSEEPIVGVSFNYRTGAFGFLPCEFSAKLGLLNVGLKDQALLFEWVQENIHEFGGDKDNVTLLGVSAGAHSIGHHLMHNTNKPAPFHRVIIESGASTARAIYPPNHPLHEDQFTDFLLKLGLTETPDEQLLEALQSLPASKILQASEYVFNVYNPSVRWPFQPVIDGPGGIIPTPPLEAWKEGRYHKIPILTGFNTNEGAIFVPHGMKASVQFTSFFRTLLPGLTEDDLKVLNETYPDPLTNASSKYKETRPGVGAQFYRAEQAYGHFGYVAPVKYTAECAATGGLLVYLYHFALKSDVIGGAGHGDHALFATHSIASSNERWKEVSGKMHACWASFIATGDPNSIKGSFSDRPVWPQYVPGSGKLALFGADDEFAPSFGASKGSAMTIVDNSWAAEECSYWWVRTKQFEENPPEGKYSSNL